MRRAVLIAALAAVVGLLVWLADRLALDSTASSSSASGASGRSDSPGPATLAPDPIDAGPRRRFAPDRAARRLARAASGAREPVASTGQELFHAVVVDERTGAPIDGAQVYARSTASYAPEDEDGLAVRTPLVRTRAGGCFRVPLVVRERNVLEIEAPGYALGLLEPAKGHGDSESALRVELRAAASLVVRVLDLDGAPRPGMDVEVSARRENLWVQSESIRWNDVSGDSLESVKTDSGGFAELSGLPTLVPLKLRFSGDGRILLDESIRLRPNEHRFLERRVGAQARIEGVAVSVDGCELEGVLVSLVPAVRRSEGGRPLHWGDETRARVPIGADHTFNFEGVPPGLWLVGHADDRLSSQAPPESQRGPVSRLVEVTSADELVEVQLELERARYVRGTLVLPDDRALTRIRVQARTSSGVWFGDSQWVGAGSTFALGPLTPGSYWLNATARSGDDTWMTESILVDADDADVVLEFRPWNPHSLEFAVTTLDASTPARGRVVLTEIGEQVASYAEDFFGSGHVVFEGLPEGAYRAFAYSEDGEVAVVESISASASSEGQPVELLLESGCVANLRAGREQRESAIVRVFWEGQHIRWVRVPPGGSQTLILPPGSVTLSASGGDAETVDVTAGSRTTIELDAP